MIGIKGYVTGEKEVARTIGRAPNVFRKALLGGLLGEKESFVGGKRRGTMVDGAFRKKLFKKTNIKGQKWPLKVARIFRGVIDNSDRIDGKKLTMGAGIKGENAFVKNLRFLASGGTISNSKFMPVPVFDNLKQNSRGKYETFEELSKKNELTAIRTGGKMLWFKTVDESQGLYGNLAFVGVKRVTVKQQFDFEGDWNKRQGRAVVRLQKRIDGAVKRIEAGKVD